MGIGRAPSGLRIWSWSSGWRARSTRWPGGRPAVHRRQRRYLQSPADGRARRPTPAETLLRWSTLARWNTGATAFALRAPFVFATRPTSEPFYFQDGRLQT